ncbi:MAG: hypothetical protein V9H69_04845 [Anaerolineae bacterium]
MQQSAARSAHLIRLARFEQQQLLRSHLERRIDQIGRGLLALPQPLGQLQQVDAAQRVDGDGALRVGLAVTVSTLDGLQLLEHTHGLIVVADPERRPQLTTLISLLRNINSFHVPPRTCRCDFWFMPTRLAMPLYHRS